MPVGLRVAGFLLAVLSFGFLASRLLGQLRQLPPVSWSGAAIGALLGVVVLVVAIEAIHSLAWRTLARAVEPRTTWRQSFVLCGRSQIAKYLPGSAFHYVQRVVLARNNGMHAVDAAALTAVDAILLLLTGIVVGLPAVAQGVGLVAPLRSGIRSGATLIVLGGALVAGGLLLDLPKVRNRIRQIGRLVTPGRLVRAALLDVVPFVLAGVTVHLVLHGLWPGVSTLVWSDFVPGFALAFVVGFITPGAPGGIGVREMVLYALYAPALGGGLAAGLFLLLRVAYLLGDAATFAAASVVHTAQAAGASARADTP